MAGFDHGPAPATESEAPGTRVRNARYGLVLFTLYLVLYSGFVLLNAFAPELMEQIQVVGVNLAIVFGFALIVAAWILALIYGWLCREPSVGERGRR